MSPNDSPTQGGSAKRVFRTALVAGSVLAAVTLGSAGFTSVSESALVSWSFLWVPVLFFGLSGTLFRPTGRMNPYVFGLVWAGFGLTSLLIFYAVIWPKL